MTLNTKMMLAPTAAALAIIAIACGGGGDDDDTTNTGQPTGGTTTAPADTGGGPTSSAAGDIEETYPVNQTFWFQGFMIEVSDAVFASPEPGPFDEREYTLTVNANFTNEGDNDSFVQSDVALVTDSDSYDMAFGSDLPDVPGGLSSDGSFTFFVDETFDIDTAYMLLGGADEQRAQVPLGPNGGELVALEPSDGTLTGSISNSLIDMNFTDYALRADYPDSHEQVEADQLALTLNFDIVSRKSGNWGVYPQEFALTLPGGSSVGVDWSGIDNLPGNESGLETKGQYLRFIVDDPASGTYSLRWTPPNYWLGDGDPSEVTFEFDIP